MGRFVAFAVVAAASACRHAPTGPTLDVAVLAGDAPMPDATVVSYRLDGSEIDLQMTDPTGRVALRIEPDALIGVGFTGGPIAQYATLPVPSGIAELDVHGPPPPPVATIAGVVTIAPQQAIAADAYDVELGCTIRRVSALPVTIEVPSPCLGEDTDLDVVVIAYANGSIVGYTSTAFGLTGPLPFDTGEATFAPAMWLPPLPAMQIADDAGATIDWAVTVDGLPFPGPPGFDWELATDGARIVATLGGGDTIQVTSFGHAVPDVVAQDFLAPIAPSLALDDRATMKLHGGACDASTSAVTNVRATWTDATGTPAVWDVVMPPGPIVAGFPPAFDAPPAGAPVTTIERCVVADLLLYELVVQMGIYLEDPLNPSRISVPRGAGDELKSTQTSDAF